MDKDKTGNYRISQAKLEEQNQRLLNALEIRNAQLHSLLISLPDQYYLFTKDGVCKEFLANDLSELIIKPDKMGANVIDVFNEEAVGLLIEEYIKNTASTGLLLSLKITIPDLLKQKRYYECRFSAINKNEVMMIVRDVTKEELYKNKLKVNVDELKKTNAKLNQYIKSNEELENFAYIASHDLKEPIRNISFYGQYLKNKKEISIDKRARYVDEIINRTFQMEKLIDDLLFYSRVDNQELIIEQFTLSDLVDETKNSLNILMEKNEATINIENDISIQADRFMFQRLFYNLIQNAIKYRSKSIPKIIIEAKETKNNILLKLVDNGIGISKQYVDYVFGIFKKIQNNQIEGVGLGLSICKRIVERHQGEISIISDLGQGTKINIQIPKHQL